MDAGADDNPVLRQLYPPGAPVWATDVASAADCCAKCAADPYCAFWQARRGITPCSRGPPACTAAARARPASAAAVPPQPAECLPLQPPHHRQVYESGAQKRCLKLSRLYTEPQAVPASTAGLYAANYARRLTAKSAATESHGGCRLRGGLTRGRGVGS